MASAATSRVLFSCFLAPGSAGTELPTQEMSVANGVWWQPGASIPAGLSRRARFRERFLSGYPLLWVENPGTRVLIPFWVPHDWFPFVSRLKRDTSLPNLPADVMNALSSAGALADPRQSGETVARWSDTLTEARAIFSRRGYASLSGLLPGNLLADVANYYQRLTETASAIGDSQCDRRYGVHNEGLARFFHYQFAWLVEQVVGQPVIPSYCYFAGYHEGAELKRHEDREQCEFSVTLLVDYDPLPAAKSSWPLWLETAEGAVAIDQALGDALLYRGRQLPHWRTRLADGTRSCSLLLHYVPLDFSARLK